MTIEEAIKRAEDTAIGADELCKRYDRASGYSRSHDETIRTNDAKMFEKSAQEHRQLAEWLKDYKRLLESSSEKPNKSEIPTSSDDCISRQDVLSEIIRFSTEEGSSVECQQLYCDVNNMPSVTPQEPRWIPVNERVAEFPCLACDIFDQIFIPSGIVVLNSRCYEGKDFDFNVEKFLRGKEVIMCGGKKAYLRPREIAAWMPLPEPYRVKGEKHDN